MRDRAAELRQEFDGAFSHAPSLGSATVENLLAFSVRSHRYAFRLSDVSGLFSDKKILWLPSRVPALLGIAGFRGTVFPVYDVGVLLGHAAGPGPRWLVLASGERVGLAFDTFDGHLRVLARAVVPDVGGDLHARHVRGVLQGDDHTPVVDVAAMLASIRAMVDGNSSKER